MHKNISCEKNKILLTLRKYGKGKRMLEESKRSFFLLFVSFLKICTLFFNEEIFLVFLMNQEHKKRGRRGHLI